MTVKLILALLPRVGLTFQTGKQTAWERGQESGVVLLLLPYTARTLQRASL
jgi:hypothetical protein